jgi:predicted ribosome quality control (RQC) complex YloA/Tae2 family protein
MSVKINELVANIKQEISAKSTQNTQEEFKKQASTQDELDDLNLQLEVKNQVSENLEKVASKIQKADSLEELVKIAEEMGNSDISNLIKIADTLGDRIADKVISRIAPYVNK